MSGDTPCACRDCMDITMSSDTSKPELCEACQEAGCEVYDYAAATSGPIVSFACQREDAYGCEAG